MRKSVEPELACHLRTLKDFQLASPSPVDDMEEGALAIQTIRTDKGEELVVISRRDYDALLARAGDEDAQDRVSVLLASEARPEKHLPHSVSAAIIDGASALKALRNWRGMTQIELASTAGVTQGLLSELEAGTKAGSAETLQRLRATLGVPDSWLS